MASFRLKQTKPFERTKKAALKKYPRSEQEVETSLDELKTAPDVGDPYPGFGAVAVRKVRIALKEYNISARNGLRLIFMVAKETVVPIYMYKKGRPPQEKDVLRKAKDQLKEILSVLKTE